jgi:hypothetical protein
MRMVNSNIIRVTIILTTMLCMEGVKTLALINHQIYCDINLTDINDSKISNHNHYFDSFEEENWNMPSPFSFTFLQIEVENQMFPNSFFPPELCNSIWQPPKSV